MLPRLPHCFMFPSCLRAILWAISQHLQPLKLNALRCRVWSLLLLPLLFFLFAISFPWTLPIAVRLASQQASCAHLLGIFGLLARWTWVALADSKSSKKLQLKLPHSQTDRQFDCICNFTAYLVGHFPENRSMVLCQRERERAIECEIHSNSLH